MSFGKGYIPDAHDPRDKHLASLGLSTAVPAAFSLQDHVVEVLDQGQSSACVAHSWAQALRIADMVAGIKDPPLPSREFLYFNARAFDGEPIEDEGTQLRSCAKGLTKFGRPPETAWPFTMSKINDRPSWDAYRQGYDHKGPAGYVRVTGLDQIKQAIAASKPVVGGASVAQSIEDYTGGIYNPSPSEPSIGGHALCFVAYDPHCFTIVNSWGPSYGEHGFIRVSYAFASTFTDLWSIHE